MMEHDKKTTLYNDIFDAFRLALKFQVSDVIAPHGCCAGYEANHGKLHDTRNPNEAQGIDTEKNKEKVTTADVTQDSILLPYFFL